ncbi:hypothetical protein AQ943_01220 [Burkholderia pseudomallei]|nr:hypothetical protein AQ943_01220 [Burkholderia pseudomallei]ONE09635.1 hypothetical protein AQ944_24710 [Burkholderia pseudomallei]
MEREFIERIDLSLTISKAPHKPKLLAERSIFQGSPVDQRTLLDLGSIDGIYKRDAIVSRSFFLDDGLRRRSIRR